MATAPPQLRPIASLRPTPRSALAGRGTLRSTNRIAPSRGLIKIVNKPSERIAATISKPKKDYGILGGLLKATRDIGSFPVTVGRMLPSIVGKTAQSVYGAGETLFDIGADIVAPGAYTSRSEEDLAKGRELGLTGPDLLAYSMQRTMPIFAPIVSSVPKTAARAAEVGTVGLYDTGDPGFDYYRAIRSGELGNMLLEDVGNIMLAGRTAGLGSLAKSTGSRLTAAGRPRLGTAIRRGGYFAEQPIAATVRGAARLAGKSANLTLPNVSGRFAPMLRNISTAGQRISESETPLRATLDTGMEGFGNYAKTVAEQKLAIKNAVDQRVQQDIASGIEPSAQLLDEQQAAKVDFDKWNKRTNEQRALLKATKPVQRRLENVQRQMTQLFARYETMGAVPESTRTLRLRARALRNRAVDQSDPALAEADYLDFKAGVKDADTQGRLTNKEQIDSSFGAAMLVGSRVIDVVKQMVDSGVSIPEVIKIIIPNELAEYVRAQGYDITPNTVQKALAYVDGVADDIDTISIREALSSAKLFGDFITAHRQAGSGMVTGAASPLELGVLPMPEYIMIELENAKGIATELLSLLDEAVVYVIQRDAPELAQLLDLDLDNPRGIFENFAKARPDSPQYMVAGRAVQEAMPVMMENPGMANFLENPMIYPATVRPFMLARTSGIVYARGQDIQTFAQTLDQFNNDNPGLLPEGIVNRIKEAVNKADDPQLRYDKKTWNQVQNLMNTVVKSIEAGRQRIVKEKGQITARSDARWARLEELAAATELARGMVQTIIDSPELFADQAQVAEVARLRGVSEEARAGLEEMGDVSPAPAVDTTQARQPLSQENLRLVDERRQIADELVQKQARAARFRARQQRAAEVADDDLASLQTELDEARLVRDEFSGTTEVSVQEARAARAEEVGRLQEQVDVFEYNTRGLSFARDIIGKKRYGGEDARGALERGLPQANKREVFNAFMRKFAKTRTPKNFNPASLVDVVDGQVVGRRESPYSNGDLNEMATEFIENFVEPGRTARYATPEEAITDMMAEFAVYYEAKKRLEAIKPLKNKKLDSAKLEEYRNQLSEDQDAQAAQYMDRAYADAGVRSPEELIELIGDKTEPEGLNSALGKTLSEIDALNRRDRDLNQRIESNKARIEELWKQQEESVPVERIAEQGRLRTIERESTEQASQLESETLKRQEETIKARLKGVGTSRKFASGVGIKVTPSGPELQKQFGGKINDEQARILSKQQEDWVKLQEVRQRLADQEEALAQAQEIPQQGGRLAAQLQQPTLAQIGGEAPMYIPTGSSRFVEPRSTVETTVRAQGIAPETTASVEKKRVGSVLPMTAGQMSARVREVMQILGRNIVIQSIINNKEFVSTVAERIPQATRDRFQAAAEQIVRNSGRVLASKPFADAVKSEYQKMVFDELKRLGLDPISPVRMPDPQDPYAERAPVKALDEVVRPQDLTDETLVMSANMRAGLASQFEPKDIARGYSSLNEAFLKLREATAAWKSVILPFSVRWQVGDHASTVLNAWLRGDVNPRELYSYMGKAMKMFMDQPGATRRDVIYGEALSDFMANPVSQALEAAGLQQSGLKAAELRAARKGTLVPPPTEFGGRRMFPNFRRKSFAFNEFQNRLGRHAVALKKLTDILEREGRSIDEINPISMMEDDVLRAAVEEAVDTTNDVLGNFSQLDPYERQVVRSIFPFWSWIKFINKAAAELLIDQPDRVLFMSHLGGLTMEPNAEGMWDFLKGDTNIPGYGLTDLSFLNAYSDSILFSQNPFASTLETGTSVSPIISFGATAAGELYYGATGSRLPYAKTLSRPGYLEGRPGETTRGMGDVLGGLAYRGLRDFGGPFRNVIDVLPEKPSRFTGPLYGLLVNDGRIRGTDVAVGPVERYGQGSKRTEGQFGIPRLSPTRGRLAAVARTFGLPAPKIETGIARRIAAQNAILSRRALLRRQTQRRLSRQ